MPTPKWLVIARNEYRIHTSRIRKIRPVFPYATIVLLAIYVAFIAPAFVNLFVDELLAFILSQVAVPLVQIILFMIFFYFLILPITNTLKEVQSGQLEIFLAAPIKPSDVLLGEFLGVIPFYSIAVVIIAGLFTAILNILGLGLAQTAIITAIFVLTFLSALWIGTVIAALLRTKLGRTARGKDIGRALALVIALPLIGIMYSVLGGGLPAALADPETSSLVKAVLGLLPSSWGAHVVFAFASNPGNIAAIGFESMARFGGILLFFLAALFMGTKAANRAYSIEPTTLIALRAKPDASFYKLVKFLGGGGSFGTLLVSVFKDYGRRLENISKIFYVVGLFTIMSLFLFEPNDPESGLVMTQLILPILSAFVVGEVTLRGKESLHIYKKTPSGVGRFVKARLLHGWLVVVPTAAVITTASTVLNNPTTLISLLTSTSLIVLTVSASVFFVLGLFLLNPAFSDKSGNYVINLVIVMQGWTGLSLVTLIVFRRMLSLGLYESLFYITVPLTWLLGIVTLLLGKRKLSRME